MGDSCDFEFLSTIHAFVGRLDEDFFFGLDKQCLLFVPFHTNGVAKCQKSDVNNFYIRLRAKNTALITSMMLNNLELLTSETQNQRSACNVLRNLHFLSFSPLANTES